MLDTITSKHSHAHSQNRFAVIPTVERIGVDDRYTGRGVRIAFLDSGFYPHPDFVDRVVEFHDIAGEDKQLDHVLEPAGHHWHGTQTVTSCAGDGRLSDRVYRGLAHRAELVLVKVSRAGRIGDAEIEAGLNWIIANRIRLKIDILNISLGGDCDLPTNESRINALVAKLTDVGVVVTVAAGNSADTHSLPPASAPSAITVGGYSDENQFHPDALELYHSSYGQTADGSVKPDLIAPAMFVAAPILPSTSDYQTAENLSLLAAAPDYAFGPMLAELWHLAGLAADVVSVRLDQARRIVESELERRKIVATHYQHVDGTSFAAPITASLVALMLEANRSLTPAAIKNILLSTARRLSGRPALRQGFGVLDAAGAIAMAEEEMHYLRSREFHPPRVAGNKVVFRHHADAAADVSLAGDFNRWEPQALKRCTGGIWEIQIDCLSPGRYLYKFVIDSKWTEDPANRLKEEDGLGGLNSVLVIE